jgi:hypothetical protein
VVTLEGFPVRGEGGKVKKRSTQNKAASDMNTKKRDRHPAHFRLDILIYREEPCWVAHCLQLDIVGTSLTSEEEAIDEAIDLCKEQIVEALINRNIEHLFKVAPGDILEKFLKAEPFGEERIVEDEVIPRRDFVGSEPIHNGANFRVVAVPA